MIWTRNNFFLLVNAGLLSVVWSGLGVEPAAGFRMLVAVAGLLTALIWVWVNVAGRLLQRRWRAVVLAAEQELFAASAEEPPVTGPLSAARAGTGEGSSVLVSITLALNLLSAGFVVIWILVLVLG
jgi:hypothetical protein